MRINRWFDTNVFDFLLYLARIRLILKDLTSSRPLVHPQMVTVADLVPNKFGAKNLVML